MWPDRVSNPGPMTYESCALPTALRGPAGVRSNYKWFRGGRGGVSAFSFCFDLGGGGVKGVNNFENGSRSQPPAPSDT